MEINNQLLITIKGTSVAACSAVSAAVIPVMPFGEVCTTMVLADCVSAWALSRRIKRKLPAMAAAGKFTSHRFGRVIVTLAKAYAALLLAHQIDTVLLGAEQVSCIKFVASAICFWQAWSILENESSCNDARWAKIAQRWLIDKTERHLGIDLSEMKDYRD
jgi:hypothetical protein